MKNQYHKKDKKALIYEKSNIADPGRMPVEAYVPLTDSEIWCYASQLSQERIYQAKGVGEDESYFFVFNYRDDIEVENVIYYKEKWYVITRVDTTDDYNTEVFVYASLIDEPDNIASA